MFNNIVAKICYYLIWVCLGVVLFSPLYVSSSLFFPFIVTKTVACSIAIEVMFVAFLGLCWKDKSYRLRVNWLVVLMIIYLLIITLASLLGNDFYHSFWSNNERSDGIILFIHLLLLVVVLTGFLRDTRNWLRLFDLFFAASVLVSIVSLDQYLALQFSSWQVHFLPSANGGRLAATLGNAGYVAGYLIFAIFIGLFLFFKRKNLGYRLYGGIIILLQIFLTIETQTRGAYLALAIGGLVFTFYLSWFYFRQRYLKIIFSAAVIIGIITLSFLFINKNAPWVKSRPILNRIASVSLQDVTVNNRLVTWEIAWQGFKERPLLGWGQENFYQVFDKYYTTKNSEMWFDRSHNMIFDRLITGGMFGLLAYLAFLLVPFYFLWRYYFLEYHQEPENKAGKAQQYLVPVVFTVLIVAYVIQNLFIFEALVTYIPLVLVLSFVGLHSKSINLSFKPQIDTFIFFIFLVLLGPIIYFFNLKPLSANIDMIKLLSQPRSLEDQWTFFEDIIGRHTLGDQEYRKQYLSIYSSTVRNYFTSGQRDNKNDILMAQFSDRMEGYLKDQVVENPNSVSNYLMLIDFYNLAYLFDVSRLDSALSAFARAQELSPGRPNVYYGGAVTYYYLAVQQAHNGLMDAALVSYQQSVGNFYYGSSLYQNKDEGFDALVNFLLSIKKDQYFWSLAPKMQFGDRNFSQLLTEISSWAITDSQRASAKDLLDFYASTTTKK